MTGKDTLSLDNTYRFWRRRLMLSMIIGYATFTLRERVLTS